MLYLAIESSVTLMEGNYETVLAVCSSKEMALSFLRDCFCFNEAEKINPNTWRYIFDGELTYFYRIEEVTIDKGRYESN